MFKEIFEVRDFTGDVYDAKRQTIEDLIKAEIEGQDLNKPEHKKRLKYIKFSDILQYAKSLNYKWSLDDIGNNQKMDIIKSIVKNNT
jgi:hypothetical protein